MGGPRCCLAPEVLDCELLGGGAAEVAGVDKFEATAGAGVGSDNLLADSGGADDVEASARLSAWLPSLQTAQRHQTSRLWDDLRGQQLRRGEEGGSRLLPCKRQGKLRPLSTTHFPHQLVVISP